MFIPVACTLTTKTWEHEILLNEVPNPRELISHYTYIIYTKVQYKFDNNNNIKQNNVMCVQLNKACCRLYQAFKIKSAIYLTNLSFIKIVNKSIPDIAEIEYSGFDRINILKKCISILQLTMKITGTEKCISSSIAFPSQKVHCLSSLGICRTRLCWQW